MRPGTPPCAAPPWGRVAAGLLLPLALLAAPAPSGAGAPGTEIAQELRSFGTLGTVLHVGAHPDDENTELITWLSLGRGYRTAYLSLTRGDGGQNELGKDFDEKLGVLRTQELLAARRLDRGRQFFTRAIDFGYSKTPGETLRFWNRDAVLGDVVRIIRQFRPDVIVTRFPVPPGSGGHGHHTASAILAVEAFKLAGDPNAYPEQLAEGLTVWQPKRILWNSFRFGSAGPGPLNGPVIKQDIGGTDPVSGQEFGTIAARSRAMHQTQGLAGAINRARTGVNEQSFMLLAGLPGDWPGQTPAGQPRDELGALSMSKRQAGTVSVLSDLMDGVDTTWARYPGGAEIGELAATALAQFKTDEPAASVPALLALRAKLAALLSGEPGRTTVDPLLADKRAQLDRILQACLGLKVETLAERAEVVPGEKLELDSTISASPTKLSFAYLGWRATGSKGMLAQNDGRWDGKHPVGAHFISTIPLAQPVTQPYWLREDPAAGIARVSDSHLIGLPENPPPISVTHIFRVGDQQLEINDEPVHVSRNAQGEHRRRLDVIPPVSLALNSEIYFIAPGAAKPVSVEVTAARAGAKGILRLETPAGWIVAPAPQDFRLPNVGDKATFTFTLTASAAGGAGRLTAVATVDGQGYSHRREELRYSHLPMQLLQPPARARLVSFPLATKGLTIGYLPGAGDSVAECLAQMGYIVRPLTGADLTPEKLNGLDAVVIGVRAFNERTDLKEALPGLFAWVEAGGTVIAQYNRPNSLLADTLGPFALSIEGPAPALRVTDETAPVTLLVPDHAALNTPNKINSADFDGWVQERGAYFPSKWDEERYTALLGMSDPGEAPLRSSILVARHGKGHYVYTGIGFFRQLPAGVPGAYRLFANLVSLGK
jgi:LmbE family N-acetylglucosaminyl deacetylase